MLERLTKGLKHKTKDNVSQVTKLLLWFGVIGFVKTDKETYIYSVNYDMKKLERLISNVPHESQMFCINKAFWLGLDISDNQ